MKSIASDVRENTFDYHCSYKNEFAGILELSLMICMYETSSRSIFLRLDQFDRLYLHCEPCENQHAINFCIALVNPDP